MENPIPDYFLKLNAVLEQNKWLDASDRAAFLSIWEPAEMRRKEILTVAGDIEPFLYAHSLHICQDRLRPTV